MPTLSPLLLPKIQLEINLQEQPAGDAGVWLVMLGIERCRMLLRAFDDAMLQGEGIPFPGVPGP